MLKIIVPIIFSIFLIYSIIYYWEKANDVSKKKIALLVSAVLVAALSLTIYFIIN